MDSDVNPRSYEHIWLVKAPWWIQCPGCLGQAVVTLRLPFTIVESPQSHKHVSFVNIASPSSRSIKRHQSPYDYETWKLYPTGYTYHLIKFWRNSVGNFFLTVFVSFFFFFKISDVLFQGQTPLAISQEWLSSFNLFLATTGDVWIIPSVRIWGYVLHVEHVSCVIMNCGQHQWVIPSPLSVAL